MSESEGEARPTDDPVDPARLIAVVDAETERVGKESEGENEVCRLERQVDSFEEDHGENWAWQHPNRSASRR